MMSMMSMTSMTPPPRPPHLERGEAGCDEYDGGMTRMTHTPPHLERGEAVDEEQPIVLLRRDGVADERKELELGARGERLDAYGGVWRSMTEYGGVWRSMAEYDGV